MSGASLARVRELVADVEGWLTDDQVERLHHAAGRCLPGQQIVEIGSFRGRSTIVLAAANTDCDVVAIDPHAGTDRGPQEISGFEVEAHSDNRTFHENLRTAGVSEQVRHVRSFSDAAHDAVDGPIHLLFIDGAHRFGPARADLEQWGARVPVGASMLVHDAFSSIGVTAALLPTVLTGAWSHVGRSGSLVEYRRIRPTPASRARAVVRFSSGMPYFVRNVLVKSLIVAGLGRLTRVLGHDQATWPH